MGLREEKKTRLRRQILDNAVELFKERGFDEVTIDEIIRRLEISQATFFNYFHSKDEILHQAAEEIVSRYEGMLREEISADAPTAEKMNRLLARMGAGLQINKRFFRTVFTRSALNFGNVRAERILTELAAELLLQGQRSGEIRSDYDAGELAEVFTGIYYSIIMRWLHGDGSDSLSERLQQAATIFLTGAAEASASSVTAQQERRRASS
jgi:AcrR family transcriptional regulator